MEIDYTMVALGIFRLLILDLPVLCLFIYEVLKIKNTINSQDIMIS